MEVIRTRPATQPGPAERFTGTVHIDSIAAQQPPGRVRVLSVHFSPGARTAWHTHPNGQILHVTEGVGLAQGRAAAVERIRAGDTVRIEAGEEHWHGAGPDTFLTHTAIHEADEDGNDATWGEHVTDEEYASSPQD